MVMLSLHVERPDMGTVTGGPESNVSHSWERGEQKQPPSVLDQNLKVAGIRA